MTATFSVFGWDDDTDPGEAAEARQQLADTWTPGDDEVDDES